MSFLDDFDPLGGPSPVKAKKKAVKQRSLIDDDDEDQQVYAQPPQPVVKKKKAKPAPIVTDSDEEEEPAPAPVVVKKKKKVVAPPPESDEEEEEVAAPPPPKKKVVAPPPPIVAAPPPAPVVKKKKKKIVETSSSSSSSSSDSSDSDSEGQPPRRVVKKVAKKPAAAAAPAPAPAAAAPRKKAAAPAPVPQAQLFDFFAPVPAAAPQGEPDDDDDDDVSEPDSPPPPPKKKSSKKAAAAPVEAAQARSCSIAECNAPRVRRGYCATHANDPSAPIPATSMSSFLGDDAEEALEGFNDLEVAPTTKRRTQQGAPQRQVQRDYGLDGDEAYYEQQAQRRDVRSPQSATSSVGSPQGLSINGRKKSSKDWRIDFENTSTSLGMNKNIITWHFVWKRAMHTVQLHHSTFGGKRKIIVDDRIRVQEKKPFADASRYDMKIGEGPLSVAIGVQIKAAGLTAFTYELLIDQRPYDQAQKFWLNNDTV